MTLEENCSCGSLLPGKYKEHPINHLYTGVTNNSYIGTVLYLKVLSSFLDSPSLNLGCYHNQHQHVPWITTIGLGLGVRG